MNLERVYEYRFRDVDVNARRTVWAQIARFLWERYERPERVLDTAAGLGEFIAQVPAKERWGVDLVDHGLSAHRDVRVVISPFAEAGLPERHFDLVFASNVLEHLASPDEVARFLGRARELLRPGGRMVVMGPNYRYCAAEYFDCADHILALTHVAVAEHLFAAGFAVDDVVPRFLPYSFRSRLPASASLTEAYLRFPPAWRILGRQFLVAGRVEP